jgi:dihydropteroate synthase
LRVIRGLPVLGHLGAPVLVPVPRKAEFARVAAFIALSLEYGADIIRVHDVDAACDLVKLFGRGVE